MWTSYLKLAFRILIRNIRFSLLNLAGLTFGLASFIIILSWVKDELSFDRFHQKKDRIVQVAIKHPEGILDPNAPYALTPIMAGQHPEIESFTVLMRMESRIQCAFKFDPDSLNPVKVYEPSVARVDTSFFEIFDFPTVYGHKEELLSHPNTVVINSRIASVYFPDSNPVGRTVLLNNEELLTISGVVDIPANTSFQFDFFMPIFEDLSNDWNWRDPAYLLLKSNADLVEFNEKISGFLNETYPNPLPSDLPIQLIPIHKTHLAFGGKGKIWLFSVVALLLVLVASLNYINLATANYSRRMRETGIRRVMGARRRQLMIHFLLETLILALAALVLGLFLTELILPSMTPLLGRKIEIGYIDQPLILPVLLFIVLLLASLASIYPSVLFSRGNPVDVLHRTFQPVSRRSAFILITIIFQFTLSIALMISSLIVIKQVRYASRADLGFSVENVISIPLNQGIGYNFFSFLDRLEQHPEITAVTAGQSSPFEEDFKTNIDWATKSDPSQGLVRYSICLNSFIDLFGIEVLEGRGFSEDFGADIDKFVINETAAGMLGFDDPLGENLTMWGLNGEIIGIVKDFHHVSLHREILPHVFNIHPSNYRGLRFIFIKMEPGNSAETLSFIETICEQFAPDYPFSYTFLDEDVGELYAADQNLSMILGLFALLALIVSSLGIYGLAFYSVEKQTKAITVRKVFGAGLGHIFTIFYRGMLARIGFSLILAIGLSLFIMTRWLQNFAYRIHPDPLLYITPAVLAILIAGFATLLAIWWSVRENPAHFLKQE